MEQEVLEDLGLNEKEAKIYLALTREKLITASKLAKITKINRTTAYLELNNLKEKGLASYIIKNNKRYYQPSAPEKLLEILDTKKSKVESIIPILKSFSPSEVAFKTEVFEGKEGLKAVYQDIMLKEKEILAFGVTGNAFELLKFEFPHFVKNFMAKGIKARYLANSNSKKLLSPLPNSFVKIKYLPSKFHSDVTTVIYGNKIALQSLLKNNIYVVVIEDASLNKGYKSYFEFMWSTTK